MAAGEYRAPRDRSLNEYVYFCLDHIRLYNAEWNFHAGMPDAAIESEIRSAATWDRPTWKLGQLGGGGRWAGTGIDDALNLARGTAFDPATRRDQRTRTWTTEQRRALKTLGITGEITVEAVKTRYKVLVKKYHPDANGGSLEAERQMKAVNSAFATLKAVLTGLETAQK